MYRYSAYIARHLVHSTLLITFSLTSIVWLTQALRFIDYIVNQGVSIFVFLKLTMLLLPSLILLILPPSLFCAVLFTYNKMKADSELIVMQAAGLSRWRLGWPAIQVGIAVAAIGYLIAMWLQPVSYKQFREMQLYLRNSYVSILLQEGVFNSPVDGLTVFVREREHDGTLHGILVHDNRDRATPVTMMAEQGSLVETPQGPRFLLVNGNRQEMRQGKLSFLTFNNYTLDISLYTQTGGIRSPDTSELYLGQLFAAETARSDQERAKYVAEAHQRLIWPGYALTLTMIALACMLSGEFNRRGHWQRITLATFIGVIVLFSGVGLRNMMTQSPVAIVAGYLNLLLPLCAACWVMTDHYKRSQHKLRAA